MTDFQKHLPAGVTLKTVFSKVIPEIHRERRHEFTDYVAGLDLIFAVRLTDTDRIWTVRFNEKEIEIEDEEGIDFPILTLESTEAQWEKVRPDLIRILTLADQRRHLLKGKPRFDKKLRAQLERFDGVIDVEIPSDIGTFKMRLILNNYEAQKGFRKFKVTVPQSVIFDVARGDLDIEAAARGLAIQGDMSLAMDLGGTFLKHYQG